jgi:5-methylcytosine-specific restriction endonuclease McrA
MNYKLTIELVPRTCWYSNVRSNVTKNEWDVIRKKSYEHANHVCEICGDVGTNQGVRHNVECHEIWDYNDETKEQTLLGLISLCPYCHKSKHVGLAQINGELHIVVNQLMKVNDITEDEALNYINKSFDIWSKRSNFEWKLNTDYLKEYIK